MKAILIIYINLTIFVTTFGQNRIEKETSVIVSEGKKLYKSEMASWYGTDIFLEKYSGQRANIGGYFSYTDNDISKCIFFSKGESPKVIGTISFDSTYNVNIAKYDSSERNFTSNELDLYTFRKVALAEIDSDTLFETYNNTTLNLIPIVENGEKKVYVLTGPQNNGVIIFGNDYLLSFDEKNNLINKKQLHKNIIVTDYGKLQKEGKIVIGGMHAHLASTGDYITPTDICTLMLYEKFAKWEQYIVMSENYVSIWDCKKDQLETLTKKAWERISKDQKKRNK